MARRSLVPNLRDTLKLIPFPDAGNLMDLQRAIGGMPIAKLQDLYEQLYGSQPTIVVDGADVLCPNRKQLVRLCQYGLQLAFYGDDLPEQVRDVTSQAMDEELAAESPRTKTRVARGPTIKDLVLALLAGQPGTYVDPADGVTKEGNVVPADEDIYKAVKAEFPESAFDRTHLAWYLTQYRKGRFEKDGYGGATGKPMGILTRDVVRAQAKVAREAERAAKAAERATKKGKEVKVSTGNVIPGPGATSGGDALAEFGDAQAVADPANP